MILELIFNKLNKTIAIEESILLELWLRECSINQIIFERIENEYNKISKKNNQTEDKLWLKIKKAIDK